MYTEKIFREGAKRFGRDPDEIKVFPGIIPSIAPTKEEALERRRQLDRNSGFERKSPIFRVDDWYSFIIRTN